MLERISRPELIDLLIAWFALSIAFAFIFPQIFDMSAIANIYKDSSLFSSVLVLLVSFIFALLTAGIGFAFHEMAHKFTAIRYGFWAEFRRDNIMLVIAVALAALVHVVFAAPGATLIAGYNITKEQNGKISAAGPLTNLLLCIPFAACFFAAGALTGIAAAVIGLLGSAGLLVNATLAAFNMLPVSILDGKKVLAWNPAVFAALFIAAFGVLIGSYYYVFHLSLF
ncbi:MAG: peptidase M50 [Methanoregulaceae archaeon]